MRRWRVEAGGLLGCIAAALIIGIVVSRVTGRVVNWYVMTDELTYQRLAVAIARMGSALPRIDGQLILDVNYLYPLLISPLYGNGDVGASLVSAHRLNAFVMASVAVPVYLLARWVGVRAVVAVATGAVAAVVPWLVYSSFLLTEVVAYPAFAWASLAIAVAVARRSPWMDLAALAAIAVAVVARTQFAVLLVVLALAALVESLLEARAQGRRGRTALRAAGGALLRDHPVLVAAYAVVLLVVVVVAVTAGLPRLLGAYGVTARDVRIDVALLQLALEHVAVLALGLAILPFLVGSAWLLERVRPSAPPRERALAVVALPALLLLTLQVASFNQRFGAGLAKERYLFYVVPLLLVAIAAALRSPPRPRAWAVLAPAAVCAAGFAYARLPRYEKLNVDEPLAMLNDWLVGMSTSVGWARVSLIVATLVAAQILLLARALVPVRAVAAVAALATAVVLPAETAYAFERLFRVPGTNGLPLTLDQRNVFGWIDRTLAGDDATTVFPYPLMPDDYWAGVAYWWDIQFWNESVTQMPHFGVDRPDPWLRAFDHRTGEVRGFDQTSYAVTHETDVRFWFRGKLIHHEREAFLVEPEHPWRAAFLTSGIYGDGWTRPGAGARIRVYADPAQATAVERSLTLTLAAPDHVAEQPVTVASDLAREQLAVTGSASVVARVCVPRGGFGEVRVSTPVVSMIGPDLYVAPPGPADRPAGIHLVTLRLADEAVPLARCPPR